ncbi:hypothetical protein D3C85_1757940 [compost metagenome]
MQLNQVEIMDFDCVPAFTANHILCNQRRAVELLDVLGQVVKRNASHMNVDSGLFYANREWVIHNLFVLILE